MVQCTYKRFGDRSFQSVAVRILTLWKLRLPKRLDHER